MMKKNFSIHEFFYKNALKEAAEDELANQQLETPSPQSPEQTPAQVGKQQTQQAGSQDQAFRSLQGQTISGVQYSPNGTTGGVIKIRVKNSYVPFVISWANQTLTITDLQGNVINLSDDQQ